MPVESYRAKNNQRVDASQITTFLCFTCGDMFSSNVDYQQHLLVHQAVSLCTQIYYLEHLNSKKERRESTEAVGPRSPAPAAEISSRRHTAPSFAERRASLEMPPRRERLPTNEEDMRKLKKQRKPVEKKKPRESFGYEPQAKKQKAASGDSFDENMIALDSGKGYLELIPQEMSCPKCIDNPTFRFPIQALSHCIHEHEATVIRVDLQFFSESSLIYTNNGIQPGIECQRCGISIQNRTLGHLHLLENHMGSVVELLMKMKALQNVTSIIGNVVFKMGTQPESELRFSANLLP